MLDKKIGIIGCGNMGEALVNHLAKVVEKSTALMVSERDAARREYIQTKYRMIVAIDNNYLVKHSDVIIIAVKPNDFDSLLKDDICCSLAKDKLLISIAAGITTGHIESVVGADMPVVRAMPNMPAMIGEGISALSRGRAVSMSHMETAKEIFSNLGDVIEVDEERMDAVTAVSGSGPAYFFYLIESLLEAAKAAGLDEATARRLVLQTALGSAQVLKATGDDPAELRMKVTSKGGTTEAAFKVLESKKVKDSIKASVSAAHKRSKELSRR